MPSPCASTRLSTRSCAQGAARCGQRLRVEERLVAELQHHQTAEVSERVGQPALQAVPEEVQEPQPGEPAEPKACAGTKGTLIVAEEMFYNNPARRQAMKGAGEEYGKLLQVCSGATAEGTPDISDQPKAEVSKDATSLAVAELQLDRALEEPLGFLPPWVVKITISPVDSTTNTAVAVAVALAIALVEVNGARERRG